MSHTHKNILNDCYKKYILGDSHKKNEKNKKNESLDNADFSCYRLLLQRHNTVVTPRPASV